MDTPYRDAVVWDRPEPDRPAVLSRAAIVHAAIGLADADGLAAVSVRKVAAALDVGPMRLYRYFDTTDELAELMTDEVYREIMTGLGGRPRHWRSRVTRLAVRTRMVMLEHDWVAEVHPSRPHLGPHGLAWLEELAGALGTAPTIDRSRQLWVALGAVSGFVFGSIRAQAAERRSARAGDAKSDWQARLGPYLTRMFETGRYPTVQALTTGAGRPDPDRAFALGLDVVLDGIHGPAPVDPGGSRSSGR